MATATPRNKTGRKQRHHVALYNGKTIEGLSRQPDGRWRVIGTAIRFTEPDERKAVARFYEIKQREGVEVPPSALLMPGSDANADPFAFDAPIQIGTGDASPRLLTEAQLYQWFAEQLATKREYVATMTGIEWLAYGPSLKAPEPLPTFKRLEEEWERHCDASDEQRRKVLHDWRDFVKTSGVQSLDGITPQVVIAYRDAVYARNMAGISQRNLFSRVRRLLSFAKSRAIAMDACAAALQALELLTPNERVVSLDPKPIDVADWRALLDAATGDNRALLLLMLNCGMYLAEAIRVRWSDIRDGCLIAHRNKTGACVRVAVLWRETLDALTKIERRGDDKGAIFYAYNGAPLGQKGAEKRFREIRKAAGVEHVVSSQLRDGAATAMAESGVTEKLVALALGHRCGISDHYVKRQPKMVEPASLAIRRHYFPEPKQSA